MAIAFVTAGTVAFSGGSSVAISVPASLVAGNTLIAAVSCVAGDVTTAPSGWTWISSSGHSSSGSLGWLYRDVDGTEAASYTFPGTSSFTGGVILQYSGVATTPNDGSPTFGGSGGVQQATATIPSIIPTGSADMWIGAVACNEGGSTTDSTPTGMTLRASGANGASFNSIAVFDKLLASSSATGTASSALSPNDYWVAGSLLLSPAGAAPSYAPPQYRTSFVPQIRASHWRERLSGLVAPEHRLPDIRLAGG